MLFPEERAKLTAAMESTTRQLSLNYETLVEGYQQGLSTQLRGFKSGPDFLETWVHDSDPRRSILGIFEAAKDAGLERLELQLGFDSIKQMNVSALGTELKTFGEVRIGTSDEGARITVRFC
jgi:hypothetical protein